MPTESRKHATDERARRYLEEAEKARAAAEITKNASERETYLKLAEHWRRLAERYDWFENL